MSLRAALAWASSLSSVSACAAKLREMPIALSSWAIRARPRSRERRLTRLLATSRSFR